MPLRNLKQSIDLAVQARNYDLLIKERLTHLPLLQEIDRLRASDRYRSPKSLIPFGDKVYSQSDEDGIIREIFNRIGVTNRCFVEFGIGNGLENNTLALLFEDWSGLWIDASTRSVNAINKHFSKIIASQRLKLAHSFITVDNINSLIASNLSVDEIDLLSVDIDGNDYHIINAIACVSPRVIVVEYNAKFTPPILYCMDYDEAHTWQKDDCFGASLKFFEQALARKGYALVGCNISGVNAFFVRSDLVGDKFLEPYTAEHHYEPPRYYLSGYFAGHPATYKTLATSLTMRDTHHTATGSSAQLQ